MRRPQRFILESQRENAPGSLGHCPGALVAEPAVDSAVELGGKWLGGACSRPMAIALHQDTHEDRIKVEDRTLPPGSDEAGTDHGRARQPTK